MVVHGETYTNRALRYLDKDSYIHRLPNKEKLSKIIRGSDSRTDIIDRHKGAWVIDPEDDRRKGYIFYIRAALKKALLNHMIPEDIFKSGNKRVIPEKKWLGMYRLNPRRVSHIEFIPPEILSDM